MLSYKYISFIDLWSIHTPKFKYMHNIFVEKQNNLYLWVLPDGAMCQKYAVFTSLLDHSYIINHFISSFIFLKVKILFRA